VVRLPWGQASYGQSVRVAAQRATPREEQAVRAGRRPGYVGATARTAASELLQRSARSALPCAFGGVRTSALAGRNAAKLRMVPLRGGRCLVGFILCDALLRVDMSCSL